MGGINISDNSISPVHKRLVDKWVGKEFNVPIERIANDLKSQYDLEDIKELETEFIGFSIRSHYPDLVIPGEFLNKVGAIVALLNNPYEYTSDLFGFINVVAVCNDVPQPVEEMVLMPSHYITRTLTAVNEILPEDYDMDEVYLHNNIQNFIFSCYIHSSMYILDRRLGSYNYDFLSKLNLPHKITKMLIEIRPMLSEIRDMVTSSKWDLRKILKGDETNTENVIEDMMNEILQQDTSELIKENLKKVLMTELYDLHYATLLEGRRINE